MRFHLPTVAPLISILLLLTAWTPACAARFCVEENRSGDGSFTIVLRDKDTGAFALIHPDSGNNCTSLTLAASDGKHFELLSGASSRSPRPSSGSGIPVLFPWPGRIPDGEYRFGGKTYKLPTSGRRQLSAMHGFVAGRKWRHVRSTADETGARTISRISSTDCPDTGAGYPYDWSLTVTHELTSRGLLLHAEVENRGSGPMPFGFGLHPWLRAPLSSFPGSATVVQIPARQFWDFSRFENLKPDSPPPALRADPRLPVAGDKDLRTPRLLTGGATVAYTKLETRNGTATHRLTDTNSSRSILLEHGPELGTVLLFQPSSAKAVCIEPWSCPPNAFNLAAHGLLDPEAVQLSPGARWRTSVRFALE